MTSDKIIRIGGGSAFFIDSALAVPQLLEAGVDYIILDYLAEGAMGLMGRLRMADAGSGFPTDFMDVHIGPHLARIAETRTKIVANAGAVNPAGLASLLRARIAELGIGLNVSCIAGDDLIGRNFPDLPAGLTSVNAYLGAFPIAAALGHGAEIVITGRVVDSALTLGPLIHEYGWEVEEFTKLAGGTVAGHLIECGAQVTGGTFTDWRAVDDWTNIGSPIAECLDDGSCIITKPDGTGGLVSFGTVAEQLLYEVGDPAAYIVPDVVVDFTTVTLEQIGPNRVRVTGVTGYPPTDTLKVCATYDDGWRGIAYQPVIGPEAREKATKQAKALFERGSMMLGMRGMADWRRTECVLTGSGEEVVSKLIVEHQDAAAAGMFVREQFAAISAMAPGTSVSFGVQVQPCMALKSFLIPKAEVAATIDGVPFTGRDVDGFSPAMIVRPKILPGMNARLDGVEGSQLPTPRSGVQLTVLDLAFTRSGEKGETINIAVIARKPEYLPTLRATLAPHRIQSWFADLGKFDVAIHEVPGINAFNIVLAGALPGGINVSQRLDPAAKGIGQRLLPMRVDIITA